MDAVVTFANDAGATRRQRPTSPSTTPDVRRHAASLDIRENDAPVTTPVGGSIRGAGAHHAGRLEPPADGLR